MSATLKGGAALQAFLADLPAKLERNVLRGALKAGADVIADGARDGCRSPEVRATIGTTSRTEKGLVTAKVQTKGDGAYKAPWLENGTDPHFISVDPAMSDGQTVRRVNALDRKAMEDGNTGPGRSLFINGKPVGSTVFHPGARPYPFMRPALDTHEQAAIAAIGNHVAAKLTKQGLDVPAEGDDE
jgi:hypothetical protein